MRLLQEKRAPGVGVVDAAGRFAGLITSETIGEMLMVREALPQGVRGGGVAGRGVTAISASLSSGVAGDQIGHAVEQLVL